MVFTVARKKYRPSSSGGSMTLPLHSPKCLQCEDFIVPTDSPQQRSPNYHPLCHAWIISEVTYVINFCSLGYVCGDWLLKCLFGLYLPQNFSC